MAILIFLGIVKAAAGLDTQRCKLREGCHCGRYTHRTSDGQEHNIIWRAGPERDTIFQLGVTACMQRARQPLSLRAIGLGIFKVSRDFVLQLIRLKSLGGELQES